MSTAERMTPLRLTIIAMEIPYPANHGGRVDVWRRLKALKRLGVQTQLLCWSPERPSPQVTSAIEAEVSEFICLSYPTGLAQRARRLIDLATYPLGVTSRLVRPPELDRLIGAVRQFEPDLLMADHVHCAQLAARVADGLGKPFIIRSHDIEHLHYRQLMRTAPTFAAKIRNYLAQRHLEAFEKNMFKRSAAVFDISSADLERWRAMGFSNGFHLPPIIDFSEVPPAPETQNFSYDAAFLGNLKTDNNITGVLWFLDQVRPLILRERPDFRIAIAGSSPIDAIRHACAASGVTLVADPADANAFYRSARVCFDPVSSGLGVSIKALDMLASGRPIVSFAKGASGLPDSVKTFFRIAHDAPSFADAVLEASDRSFTAADTALLKSELGDAVIQRFVGQISQFVQRGSA